MSEPDFEKLDPEGLEIGDVEFNRIRVGEQPFRDCLVVNWSCEFGFGQLTLVAGENGLEARTEHLGHAFVERVLRALARKVKVVE